MERVKARYQGHFSLPDKNGNFPLHLVASQFQNSNEVDDDEDDDDEGDLLNYILSLFPTAVSQCNYHGQLP